MALPPEVRKFSKELKRLEAEVRLLTKSSPDFGFQEAVLKKKIGENKRFLRSSALYLSSLTIATDVLREKLLDVEKELKAREYGEDENGLLSSFSIDGNQGIHHVDAQSEAPIREEDDGMSMTRKVGGEMVAESSDVDMISVGSEEREEQAEELEGDSMGNEEREKQAEDLEGEADFMSVDS